MLPHAASRRALPLARALLAACVSAACAGGPAEAQPPAEPPRAPLATFAYDRSAALDLRLEPSDSPREALTVHRVTFASPAGGAVRGWLVAPKATGPHAGVVVLHGLPGNAEGAIASEGLALAERGAVVIAIDAPWVRRGGLPDLTARDSTEQVQLMQDLQRAVDVLLTRPDVDPSRLAYVGGSYGGAMGALFAAVERRLAAVVLFVPDGGLVAHFTDEGGRATGPLAALPAAARARWIAAMRPIEPIRFIADAAPTPILFQNGRTDALVTSDDAQALHAAAREPKTVRWYEAGHGLTAAARAERRDWLFERLGAARTDARDD